MARLDFFEGGYLPRLSFNYVGMSKDMGKRLPQLYYIMMKISYDLGFIAIGVAMAKYQQILWERFRNILTRSFNNHKNSEIACYPHNSLIF